MSEPVRPQRAGITPAGSQGAVGPRHLPGQMPWLAMAALLAFAVYQLRSQGRLWWCACGEFYPWSGDIWSRHNSQHLFDPYSFTHVLHGVMLYWLLAWACPRLPWAWRLVIAVACEALFEVVENTAFVIERYRTATAALDYRGDAIANSVGDMLSFVAGFALARRLGPRGSLVLFVITEIVLVVWIRDSLLLNILMLIYPIDAVRAWQLGR